MDLGDHEHRREGTRPAPTVDNLASSLKVSEHRQQDSLTSMRFVHLDEHD